jgi:hypothetical protein
MRKGLLILILGACNGGGGGGGGNDCLSLCDRGNADECIEEDDCVIDDCDAYCSATEELYNTAGCSDDYEALRTCFDDNFDDSCAADDDLGPCGEASDALEACLTTWCMANAEDCQVTGLALSEEIEASITCPE